MLTEWLEQHQLTCPIKAMTGMDCPGCGMQRSLIALLHGDLPASFLLWPGLLPVMGMFVFLFLHLKFRFKRGAFILTGMFIFSLAVILTGYVLKQAHVIPHG